MSFKDDLAPGHILLTFLFLRCNMMAKETYKRNYLIGHAVNFYG